MIEYVQQVEYSRSIIEESKIYINMLVGETALPTMAKPAKVQHAHQCNVWISWLDQNTKYSQRLRDKICGPKVANSEDILKENLFLAVEG